MNDLYKNPGKHPEKAIPLQNSNLRTPLVDLLLLMDMQEDDRPAAEKAFKEFFERFEPYLRNVCYKYLFTFRSYDEEDLNNLLSNTFNLLYQNAGHLLHIETIENENEKEAIVKAWLGKVASHEAQRINKAHMYYRNTISVTDDFCTLTDKLITDTSETESPSSTEMLVLNEVLNELSPREKDIILTYYQYLQGRKHLPTEEIQRLCDEYHILPDNLNHIKFRTFKKIKQKSLEKMQFRNSGYNIKE